MFFHLIKSDVEGYLKYRKELTELRNGIIAFWRSPRCSVLPNFPEFPQGKLTALLPPTTDNEAHFRSYSSTTGEHTKAKAMSTDILYFVIFLALSFMFRAASQPSGLNARKRAERARILEMYAEFEAHVNGQVKQALRMIDRHSAAETQHTDSELSKMTAKDLKKLRATSGELLQRVEKVEEILNTLFEGKLLLFL